MQQAITWANVDPDLCRHLASLGHNELSHAFSSSPRPQFVSHIPYSWIPDLTVLGIEVAQDQTFRL